MCGIAGAVWSDPKRAVARLALKQMTDAIAHRGPDGEGFYWHQSPQIGIGLGHRRLAVIDLNSGDQPMYNADRSLAIVFNGEIYNYRELREDLRRRGCRFATESDTEVILRSYEVHAEECVKYLDGMFAFAIWDQSGEQLFLARDRLGKKPLIYREEPGRLTFASELKAILTLPDVPRKIDPEILDQYFLLQYVPHPESVLVGFQKLLPGHRAVYRNGKMQVSQYWNPDIETELRVSESEYHEQLRALLDKACRARMISDVPLGAFLSGGVDSTIIAGLMQRHSTQPIRTFSIGFSSPEYDETPYALQAAKQLGTQHEVLRMSADIDSIISKIAWHYDEPFADDSAVPTFALCQMARQHVTVALNGDGGDELFWGYDWCQRMAITGQMSHWPSMLTNPALRALEVVTRGIGRERLGVRIGNLRKVLAEDKLSAKFARMVGTLPGAQRQLLYTPDFQRHCCGNRSLEPFFDPPVRRDFLSRVMWGALRTYLPCDLMAKVDIASMAFGLECRSPFLDHHVVEWALRVPARYKLFRGKSKIVLKQAFRDLLPAAIATRPKKGFSMPVDQWLRKELRQRLEDTLCDTRARERGIFQPAQVEKMIAEHVSGKNNHGRWLWTQFMFEQWCRTHLDRNTQATDPGEADSLQS